jgi:hypothetical protein
MFGQQIGMIGVQNLIGMSNERCKKEKSQADNHQRRDPAREHECFSPE